MRRARIEELALVAKVRVDGVALHSRPLGDGGDGRLCGADARMQADRGLHDPHARLRLAFRAPVQLVLASHCTEVYSESLTAASPMLIIVAQYCAMKGEAMYQLDLNSLPLMDVESALDPTRRVRVGFPHHSQVGNASTATVYFELEPGMHVGRIATAPRSSC